MRQRSFRFRFAQTKAQAVILIEHIILCPHLKIKKIIAFFLEENKKLPDTECRLLHCFGFIGLFFLICFCAYLFPQNKNTKKEASPKSRSTFGVKVNAVVINAAVTDKSGNPVTDLTAGDFKLYDDGKPQNIQTFALESIDPPELEKAQVPGCLFSTKTQVTKT